MKDAGSGSDADDSSDELEDVTAAQQVNSQQEISRQQQELLPSVIFGFIAGALAEDRLAQEVGHLPAVMAILLPIVCISGMQTDRDGGDEVRSRNQPAHMFVACFASGAIFNAVARSVV